MQGMVDLVRRSLAASTREEFERRVDEQAAYLAEELRAGRLDNADAAVGLELELYAVDDDGRLARLPDGFFDRAPVNPELGLHNAEVNTAPAVLDGDGFDAQTSAVRDRLERARRVAGDHDRRLVLDAMWTVPPAEGSRSYLSETREVDGVRIAANMYESPRYCALDNDILSAAGGSVELDLPGARFEVPSILVESLTSSIQPHLQIPDVESFPAHFNVAIRTLGPVLALSSNSPFLPADLYAGADAGEVLDGTFHELRIPTFEQSINAGRDPGKVRVPRDIERPEDVVRRLVEDRTVAPFLHEWIETEDEERYAEAFPELDHKHGTYWRWVRPVIGGDYIDADNDRRSLRVEYRPLPTQPSVDDIVGLQALVAGLILGLVDADHPLSTLDWDDARRGFYNAVEDGLGADLYWMTEDGERTGDRGVIYEEVFRFARRGLRERGVSGGRADALLDPIERRWDARTTPSGWKLDRVRRNVADGMALDGAIRETQSEYVRRSCGGGPFADWG